VIEPTYAAAHLAADRIYSHLATHSALAQFSAEHAATLPDAATLAALIDSAFWTSLRREEGYVPRISLAFVAPELRVHPRLGRKEDSAPSGRSRSAPRLRMEAVEQGMAVWGFLPNPAKRHIPEGYANRRAINSGTGATTKAYRTCMKGVGV
jgi:hypothetical protein